MSGTRAKAIALLTALQLTAGAPLAQDAGVRSLFPARPTGYVTDIAGVVDQAAEARITDLAERLKAATGAEIAVVTLPTIGDRERGGGRAARSGAPGASAPRPRSATRRETPAWCCWSCRGRKAGRAPAGCGSRSGRASKGIVTDVTAGRIRDLMGERLAQRGLQRRAPGRGRGARRHHRARVRRRGHRAHQCPSGRRGRAEAAVPLAGALPILLFIVFLLHLRRHEQPRPARKAAPRRRILGWRSLDRWWLVGGGGWGGGGGGWGGGFGGFGGGGGFSGGGAGGRF